MKFVDVPNDNAFRKIFGNENKKKSLVSFLNAVIDLPMANVYANKADSNPDKSCLLVFSPEPQNLIQCIMGRHIGQPLRRIFPLQTTPA